jgi:predicted transcriptional regulator
MPTTTIRVSTQTRETLHELAEASGVSMQKVLDIALEVYRRQQLLEEANTAYARLRDKPAAWEEVERERRQWDATLGDGLGDGFTHEEPSNGKQR